jgi:hypothetical protein
LAAVEMVVLPAEHEASAFLVKADLLVPLSPQAVRAVASATAGIRRVNRVRTEGSSRR